MTHPCVMEVLLLYFTRVPLAIMAAISSTYTLLLLVVVVRIVVCMLLSCCCRLVQIL